MKTFTEFSGYPLREAYQWRYELVQAKRKENRSQTVPPATPVVMEAPNPPDDHIKTPDERYVEIMARKNAEREQRIKEWNDLLGQIQEPLTLRMKEKFQWPDDKLALASQALDVVDREHAKYLRRIVVLKPENPEEPLPKNGKRVGEYVFVAEYLLPPRPPVPEKKHRMRKGKGRKRGKRKGPDVRRK